MYNAVPITIKSQRIVVGYRRKTISPDVLLFARVDDFQTRAKSMRGTLLAETGHSRAAITARGAISNIIEDENSNSIFVLLRFIFARPNNWIKHSEPATVAAVAVRTSRDERRNGKNAARV